MYKFISSHIKAKPDCKNDNYLQYTLNRDQLITLPLLRPPYQSDLDETKVQEMIASYQTKPEFGHFKNTLIIAVRMIGQKCLYLVDGQHRFEMCKRHNIYYSFRILFYPIVTDDEMRHLFREINHDSYKNLTYVSLGADTARLVDDFMDHYKEKPFTKKKGESRLHTLKSFTDALSVYIQKFTDLPSLIQSIEQKQLDFIQLVDFTHSYAEEKECIQTQCILPLKECNFIEYLLNNVEPEYKGKGKSFKTIPQSLKTAVWDRWIGMGEGQTVCCVCKVITIYQSVFHCGHIVAKSRGGLNIVENLRPICQSCNSSMGNQNMDDFIRLCTTGTIDKEEPILE
jgi:5-methylcytosine-specific restriction endonuclease McrA